jgi:uncharacterized protein (TIGR02996 family)
MGDEQAFQQAMLANPDDDSLRLVFADWLEERGDRRGELLRLTHTLTQTINVPKRAALEARLQTLVDDGVAVVGPYWTNRIGMRFAWIPAGTFLMGTPKREQRTLVNKYGMGAGGLVSEEIQHPITLTRGFWLSLCPVTQAQWRATMPHNPRTVKGENLPVEEVSWLDAVAYCNSLSTIEGRKPYYQIRGTAVERVGSNAYHLPTEAQWEFACRAGCSIAYRFGVEVDHIGPYAWSIRNADAPQPVGQKKPNGWGLYDMHGNVHEWCCDWDGPYLPVHAADPHGPVSGTRRVLRGGSWNSGPFYCRASCRNRAHPTKKDPSYGFRICFPRK